MRPCVVDPECSSLGGAESEGHRQWGRREALLVTSVLLKQRREVGHFVGGIPTLIHVGVGGLGEPDWEGGVLWEWKRVRMAGGGTLGEDLSAWGRDLTK